MPIKTRTPSVQMINLGCAKNVVDSEEMLGVLAGKGYRIDADGRRADVVVVNTCGFIEDARKESIDAILEALERKKEGRVGKVVVSGCLAQRYAPELRKEIPEMDALIGTGQIGSIGDIVGSVLRERSSGFIPTNQLFQVPEKPHHRWLDVPTRILSTAPWTAYLKISQGCGHPCTFWSI